MILIYFMEFRSVPLFPTSLGDLWRDVEYIEVTFNSEKEEKTTFQLTEEEQQDLQNLVENWKVAFSILSDQETHKMTKEYFVLRAYGIENYKNGIIVIDSEGILQMPYRVLYPLGTRKKELFSFLQGCNP